MFDQAQDHIELLDPQLGPMRQAWQLLRHPVFSRVDEPILSGSAGIPPVQATQFIHFVLRHVPTVLRLPARKNAQRCMKTIHWFRH
jgi:hypothetical protein